MSLGYVFVHWTDHTGELHERWALFMGEADVGATQEIPRREEPVCEFDTREEVEAFFRSHPYRKYRIVQCKEETWHCVNYPQINSWACT